MTILMVTDEGKEEESEPLPDLLSTNAQDGSVEAVVLSPKLIAQQRRDCKQVLEQFACLFSLTPELTNWCVHDIDTGDSLSVKNKLYRLSDQVKANIKAEVAKILELKMQFEVVGGPYRPAGKVWGILILCRDSCRIIFGTGTGPLRETSWKSTAQVYFKVDLEGLLAAPNQTVPTEFIILGFPQSRNLQPLIFSLLFMDYLLTACENAVIIFIICKDRKLHTPMYFFLGYFSLLEMCCISVTVPKMLACLLSGGNAISFGGCIAQLFFFFFLSSTECILFTEMAFDRYLAICNPLRYSSIMSRRLCFQLVMLSWIGGFITTFIPIFLISRLYFCGLNIINHFFCDAPPLLNLSCSTVALNNIINLICSSLVIVSSVLIILVSYIYIISAVLKVPSTKGKRKAFSTCASHLTVVFIYYGTVSFMYVRPKASDAFDSSKIVAVFYTLVTPLLNPFIYCFRNNDVKKNLKNLLCVNKENLNFKTYKHVKLYEGEAVKHVGGNVDLTIDDEPDEDEAGNSRADLINQYFNSLKQQAPLRKETGKVSTY
ncbi:olfactory receptor 6B1-like [Pleurodeles waltl]|uniref:olfactory receptor 6B1-like n=1 Tax=Pleurodeles waltl TaxID=8319 RepID=UPI0037098F6E